MNEDKELIQSKTATIYQKETNVDKIQFLFPQKYQDIDLSKCTAVMKYTDQGNEPHGEILELQEELYKERLQYIYSVTTDFTRFAGDIEIYISFLGLNTDNGLSEEVMHTSKTIITIHPIDVFNSFVADSNLSPVDKLMLENKAMAQANQLKLEEIENKMVDDLILTDDLLQVSSKNVPLGEGVTILVPGVDDGEFDGNSDGLLDLDSTDISTDTDEPNNDEEDNGDGFIEL